MFLLLFRLGVAGLLYLADWIKAPPKVSMFSGGGDPRCLWLCEREPLVSRPRVLICGKALSISRSKWIVGCLLDRLLRGFALFEVADCLREGAFLFRGDLAQEDSALTFNMLFWGKVSPPVVCSFNEFSMSAFWCLFLELLLILERSSSVDYLLLRNSGTISNFGDSRAFSPDASKTGDRAPDPYPISTSFYRSTWLLAALVPPFSGVSLIGSLIDECLPSELFCVLIIRLIRSPSCLIKVLLLFTLLESD